MDLKHLEYLKIPIAICILVVLNLLPVRLGSADSSNVNLELYPKDPGNFFYPKSDTTITLTVSNLSGSPLRVKLQLENVLHGSTILGRDGKPLPLEEVINDRENFCYGVALLPDEIENEEITFALLNEENRIIDRCSIYLHAVRPKLSLDEIESKAIEDGITGHIKAYSIPRYRRYWHPEFDEKGGEEFGYVWLVVGENGNFLIDDNGKRLAENLCLPCKIESTDYGSAPVWTGNSFENIRIPTTSIEGDLSFNFERFGLFYAEWCGSSVWVTRRSFYWTSGGGFTEEAPDTERIELWVSAENGKKLFTISDYHHYAFRHNPVESYIILSFWHCPIPSDVPAETWFNFVVADYENVYSCDGVQFDHLGFSPEVHPVGSIVAEYSLLIKRNLIAIFLILCLYSPDIWRTIRSK